jgi:peptide/nickel transport system substrate-binding protein
MKKSLALIIALIILVPLGYYIVREIIDGRSQNELIYLPYQRPDNLIPILDMNQEAKYLDELIFDGLVNKTSLDAKGREQFQWALVDSGGYREESWDNTRLITIYLRKGVLWHDGREFVADDVVYTWNAIMQSRSPLSGWLASFVEAVEPFADDNYKIKIKLRVERSREAFMELFSPVKILPYEYSLNGEERNLPYNWNEKSPISEEFKKKPVGTGPYRVVDSSPDVVVLDTNENYYLGSPSIKRIQMRVEKVPLKAVEALKENELGLLFNVPQEAFDILDQERLEHTTYFPYGFYVIAYNTRRTPFSDSNFRKAVNSATDKRELARSFIPGANDYCINTGVFPKSSMYVQDSPANFQERNPYDVTRAKAYLDRSSLQEKAFHLLVSTIEGARTGLFTETYKTMMANAGITVALDVTNDTYFKQKVLTHDFDAALVSYTGFDHLYDVRTVFGSDPEKNIWGVSDPQLSNLLDRFGKNIAWDSLKCLTAEIHSRVEDIAPGCFLFTAPQRAYYSDRLTNVTVHPEVGFSTVERWEY